MDTLTRTRLSTFVSGLLSDKGLTKKAYLNALASMMEYAATLLVGFFLTPFVLAGLGHYSFGLWQVLNRLAGYLTSATGRPTDALKWTLVAQQASNDFERKRRYIGSTVMIWVIFLPVLIGLGALLVWGVPHWINVPAEYVGTVRIVSLVLMASIVLSALLTIPQAVLQAENLGYKRMGLSTCLILLGGISTWLALQLKAGIIGVSLSALLITFLTGIFFLIIVRHCTPWFGIAKPNTNDVRDMLGRSWWFLGWSLVMRLLLASDVVILGIFDSIGSVTNYTLTKYAPEMMIPIIANVVFAVLPGLGGIVGSGDLKRVVRLRGEMMSMIWLVATVIGTGILLCNRSFLGLWVGIDKFAGPFPQLLIVVSVMQFVLIRSDGHIIDVTLRLNQKVLLGILSVAISVVAASILVGYFDLGIIGLCLGILAGRLILSIGYPVIISHFLRTSLPEQFRSTARPILVTILLFGSALTFDNFLARIAWWGTESWIGFFIFAGLSAFTTLVISFYTGLTSAQRSSILQRARMVYSAPNRQATI